MNHAVAGAEASPASRSTPIRPVDALLAATGLAAPLVAEVAQADTAVKWVAGGAAALAGLKLVFRLSRPQQTADTEILPLHMLDRSGQL